MLSRSVRICSDETLGMQPSESGPGAGTILVPPIISAQSEIYAKVMVLDPLKKKVLQGLQRLLQGNRPESWFTIYLAMFVLLHSCGLLTARDAWRARNQELKVRLARFVSKNCS